MTVILISAAAVLLGFGCLITGFRVAFSKDNPDGEMLRGCKKVPLGGGYLYCRMKRRLLRKFQREKQEEQRYRALHVNENPRLFRLLRECRQGLLVFGILILSGVLSLLAQRSGVFSDTEIHSFERPSAGSEKYRLRAYVGENEYDVEFSLRERTYTEEEVKTAWEEALPELTEQMLGNNPCADEVSEALVFVRKLAGTNVDLLWMPSDYKIVDYDGKVYPERAAKEGSVVVITVEVKYGGFVAFSDIPIRVVRGGNGEMRTVDRVKEELQKSDADQKYEQVMELPTDVGDTPVTFYKKRTRTPWCATRQEDNE